MAWILLCKNYKISLIIPIRYRIFATGLLFFIGAACRPLIGSDVWPTFSMILPLQIRHLTKRCAAIQWSGFDKASCTWSLSYANSTLTNSNLSFTSASKSPDVLYFFVNNTSIFIFRTPIILGVFSANSYNAFHAWTTSTWLTMLHTDIICQSSPSTVTGPMLLASAVSDGWSQATAVFYSMISLCHWVTENRCHLSPLITMTTPSQPSSCSVSAVNMAADDILPLIFLIRKNKRQAIGSQPNLASRSVVMSIYNCPQKFQGACLKFKAQKTRFGPLFRDFCTRHCISPERNIALTNKNASVCLQCVP